MNLPKLLHATRWIHLLERDGWIFASRRRPEAPMRIDGVAILALHAAQPGESRHRLVVIEEFRVPIDRWEQAAISARLWPVLVAVAHAGSFAGVEIAEWG